MNIINESGRSMVEMLGVLCIVGVLTIGAASVVQFGMRSYQATNLYSRIENAASDVSDRYSWRRTYPEKLTQDLATTLGGTYDNDNGKIKVETPLGTMVVAAKDADGFTIMVNGVPKSPCQQLQSMKWVNVSWRASNSCTGDTNNITFDSQI